MVSMVTFPVCHVGGHPVAGERYMVVLREMDRMIPGFSSTFQDTKSKKRYAHKLALMDGIDPYEIPLNEVEDNVDQWLAITHNHVCI